MSVITSAISTLQTLVTAIGAGLGVWGVINLLEGYGNDQPGNKSQGIKQLMAGGGIILIGTQLVPQLSSVFGGGGTGEQASAIINQTIMMTGPQIAAHMADFAAMVA